jgi:hypothetical protein
VKTSSDLSDCLSRDASQVTVAYGLIQEILILLKIDSTGLQLTRNDGIGRMDFTRAHGALTLLVAGNGQLNHLSTASEI